MQDVVHGREAVLHIGGSIGKLSELQVQYEASMAHVMPIRTSFAKLASPVQLASQHTERAWYM